VSQPTILEQLGHTVRRHEPEYQRVREREPALAPHATASALFDALGSDARVDPDGRQLVLRTIVLAYQRTRHPVWYALAFRALAPMLGGLRKCLRQGGPEEREQDLQVAFVEAIVRLRIDRACGPTFPLLTLRRALARALFPRDRAAEDVAEVAFDEGAAGCAPSPHEDPLPFVQCLAREVRQWIGEDAARVLSGAETLGEQAERLAQSGQTYERLQGRHRRTVERARHELRRSRSEPGRR
jgi:hypothetical protein